MTGSSRLGPEVSGACKGVVRGAICVGVETSAEAVLTQQFCAYTRRGKQAAVIRCRQTFR